MELSQRRSATHAQGSNVVGLWARLRSRILAISPTEASFSKRRFPVASPQKAFLLEHVGRAFLHGYNTALQVANVSQLEQFLSECPSSQRGFAYEGAAMALALLDVLQPIRRARFAELLAGGGSMNRYMLHVGAGWVLGRLPLTPAKFLRRFDPLLRWLVIDGYGFHQGYFHWERFVREQVQPRDLNGYAKHAFDHGLGRSLWFIAGADVARVAEFVAGFAQDRQEDVWSGAGLACTYAGGADADELRQLKSLCWAWTHLKQGAVFAAAARELAGNSAEHTELACRVICGLSAPEASALADAALAAVNPVNGSCRYEAWRAEIRRRVS